MNEHNQTMMQRQMDSFPVLPVTVAQILRDTGAPESSAADLMAALLPDQSLCATVLKLANSALFGRPRRVDSLQAAIMVLGFNRVQSIALVKAMPKLEAYFHYRNLDVSTLKELARRWRPELHAQFKKHQKHTALADVEESIDELVYYREHFLRMPEPVAAEQA